MGYKTIQSSRGGKIYGVRVSCYRAPRESHVFLLSLGEDVVQKMGWQKGSHIAFALGDGKQAGWLRLKTNELGGHTLFRVGKGSVSLSISLQRLADDQPHPREAAPHKIKNAALYVKLPEWAKI